MTDPLTIIHGDALSSLRGLADESVQCCVTSPPYWGLRDYGHEWQIGLEKTPDEYIARLVEVFRELKRVLRADGTLWLNLGDSYATGGGAVGRCPGGGDQGERFLRAGMINTQPNRMPLPGLKPKDLVGIPWMVAFALRADGWYLRSDIIWSKPNPMPESVTDRPTKSHEYIFLLSKSQKYYYDAEAIREDNSPTSRTGGQYVNEWKYAAIKNTTKSAMRVGVPIPHNGRNKRSVWTVTSNPFPDAHFATFPPDLIKPCILAGAPVGGIVLDPFAGSFTTCKVAIELGRKAIGIEPKAEYVEMGKRRCQTTIGLPFTI